MGPYGHLVDLSQLILCHPGTRQFLLHRLVLAGREPVYGEHVRVLSNSAAQPPIQLTPSKYATTKMTASRIQIVEHLAVGCLMKHVVHYDAQLNEAAHRGVGILLLLHAVPLGGEHAGQALQVVEEDRVELRVDACAQVLFADLVLELLVGGVKSMAMGVDSKVVEVRSTPRAG